MSKLKNEVLASVGFGQFGNYGARLAVEVKDDGIILSLENWAYGEVSGNISVHGIGSEKLAQLGKELIHASLKLEEIEKAYK